MGDHNQLSDQYVQAWADRHGGRGEPVAYHDARILAIEVLERRRNDAARDETIRHTRSLAAYWQQRAEQLEHSQPASGSSDAYRNGWNDAINAICDTCKDMTR